MANEVIGKIDQIVSRINTHLEYSVCAGKEKFHALRTEAEKHSLEIELLNEGKKLSDKARIPFLDKLEGAFNLLSKEGITNYSLSRLGTLIEPEQNASGGFRPSFIAYGGFNAPDPKDVPFRIQHLVDFLKSPDFHPVVKAANAHLELVEIHPYMDGNGRSARLLQNFCLQEKNYPPAVISAGELNTYIRIIHNALKDRYNGTSNVYSPSVSEKEFQGFISQRVLNSATALESELKKRRMYEVEITKVKAPGIVGTIANRFRAFGKNHAHNGVSVMIKKENGKKRSETLRVVGDIGREDVEGVLSSCKKQLPFDYSVKVDYC